MPKTVIIGAGSGFGSRLSVDILAHPGLRSGTIALVDIDKTRNDYVAAYVRRAAAELGADVEVVATTDRREALPGADFVVTSFHIGGPAYTGKPYYYDVEIPNKYGVYQTVADTIGPGGIVRFLRTMPTLAEMLRDMEELCPSACVLNYVNPMGMLAWAANDTSALRFIGLCHSVQGTAEDIAELLGMRYEELRYRAAGINHMAWFLELRRGDVDLYPRFRQLAESNEEWLERNCVRNDIMRSFGYFPCESSVHHAEYYPYFRKSAKALEHYHQGGPRMIDPNAGYERRNARWQSEEMQAILSGEKQIDLSASNEFAATIINSMVTGQVSGIYANVRNRGLIPNLPPDCIVEVPALVDHNGWQPCYFGELPAQCAALNTAHVSVQRVAVQAWKEASRETAIQAMMLDPLTASVCTLDQARAMANELLDSQPEHLGYLR
jgi:alpha-galactosidase